MEGRERGEVQMKRGEGVGKGVVWKKKGFTNKRYMECVLEREGADELSTQDTNAAPVKEGARH